MKKSDYKDKGKKNVLFSHCGKKWKLTKSEYYLKALSSWTLQTCG